MHAQPEDPNSVQAPYAALLELALYMLILWECPLLQ